MDADHFDTLSRAFGTSGTRRRLLGGQPALLPAAGRLAAPEETAA